MTSLEIAIVTTLTMIVCEWGLVWAFSPVFRNRFTQTCARLFAIAFVFLCYFCLKSA